MKSKEEFVQFFSKFVVCVCAHMSVYVCVCVLWGDCIDCKQENNVVTTIAITSLDVLSLEHQELKETRLACCFSVVRSHPISQYCWERGMAWHTHRGRDGEPAKSVNLS